VGRDLFGLSADVPREGRGQEASRPAELRLDPATEIGPDRRMKLLALVVIGLCWGSLATAAGPSFSFEFRRTGDRLVKVGVTSDQNGSLIRTLVIDVKTNGAAAESVRDRQRPLTPEEADRLQALVAGVRP